MVAVSRRNRGSSMEKTTLLEGNSLFMNSEMLEIRKVQVKLRGTTCCLQGRPTRATWVSCPRFVKNCPGPSFRASNTCTPKITWQISSTKTEYFVPLWSVLLETFARRSSIMFDIDNSANIENVNFEREVLLIIILDESKFEIFWIN